MALPLTWVVLLRLWFVTQTCIGRKHTCQRDRGKNVLLRSPCRHPPSKPHGGEKRKIFGFEYRTQGLCRQEMRRAGASSLYHGRAAIAALTGRCTRRLPQQERRFHQSHRA